MAKLPPLGAHVSVAGGLVTSIERAMALGCTAAQVFVKNASQWRWRELAEEEAAAFRAARAGSCVGPLVAHASYLINLCTTDPALLARSREALADELERCGRLGIDGLVLHPGAHLGAGEEVGIDLVARSLDIVLAALPGVETRVLLENTAGQGSCLGYRLEHLAAIRARVASPHRVGVCLDTCHAFAAGYAIHRRQGYEDFVAEIEARLGLAAVGCFHLNDSLRPFDSRRDRHAHIGEGEIGLAAFARLLHDPRLRAIPMVLETEPGDEMAGHRRDLEVLRGLRKPRKPRQPVSSPSRRSAG
ncbi:MAG TPA: deoxyribonuclease IV [Thermoanaerobaculia bacterium]|jgi:deoxyribonuclease-4|nr:deoxyribonuclease IV [Thermoanaerobaculia bacterium]